MKKKPEFADYECVMKKPIRTYKLKSKTYTVKINKPSKPTIGYCQVTAICHKGSAEELLKAINEIGVDNINDEIRDVITNEMFDGRELARDVIKLLYSGPRYDKKTP